MPGREVSRPGWCLVRGMPGSGGSGPGGFLMETPRTDTAAGGTHPTGMHSCLYLLMGCAPCEFLH